MAEVSQEFLVGLRALEGRFVNVRVRRSKVLGAEPGEESSGFYFVDIQGIIEKPALKMYPEDSRNGTLCLYVRTVDQTQKIYAIAVDSIDEVDDEVQRQEPVHVTMTGLTKSE